MADLPSEVASTPPRSPEPVEDRKDLINHSIDIHSTSLKIQRAHEVYKAYAGLQDRPGRAEVLGWYFYGLCSYFIHTVLIPIIFPLIISYVVDFPPPEPKMGWNFSKRGLVCSPKQMQLYEGVASRSVNVNSMSYSPLQWTSISWVTGLLLAGPILGSISLHLDHGRNHHQLITAVSIAIGSIFCLPVGFIKNKWVFPIYISFIIATNTIAAACHTRHMGLMVRGFVGPLQNKDQFPIRKGIASQLSLYATTAGGLGSAIMTTFTYKMIAHSDKFTNLWVVSIFSGLKWLAGAIHVLMMASRHTAGASLLTKTAHMFSIFQFPHAGGSLVGVFLSSFSSMCIFTGGVLFLIGHICVKPAHVLYLLLTYFIFPLLSLPLAQPLQRLIKADAVKMQLMGFLLTTVTSGVGFYFRYKNWNKIFVLLLFSALQGTSVGLLHAFGRVLLLDCSPPGKEGAFSVWFSWVRALGTCGGFAFTSVVPGNVGKSFGVSFCAAVGGIVVLIFGNITSFGAAVDAGHVRDQDSEKSSPVHGLDSSIIMKRPTLQEEP